MPDGRIIRVLTLQFSFALLLGYCTLSFCSQKTNSDSQSSLKAETPIEDGSISSVPSSSESGRQLVVYYFMSTFRCPSCMYIEKTTEAVVKNSFASEVKSGRLVFKALNIDKPENKHFEKDYKLYSQSVVLSDIKDGKEMRWVNLDKVWKLLNNDPAFQKYISQEIRSYIGE